MKHHPTLLLTTALLSACSFDYIKIPRNKQAESFYLKATTLEIPPQNLQEHNSTTKPLTTEKKEITALSQLNAHSNGYSLTIHRPFNQSWNLVEKVLTNNSIPIKDRNRNQGLYLISLNDYLKSHHKKESFLPFSLSDLFTVTPRDQEIKLILTQYDNSIQLYAKWNDQTETADNTQSNSNSSPLNLTNDETLVTLLKSIYETINSDTIPLR